MAVVRRQPPIKWHYEQTFNDSISQGQFAYKAGIEKRLKATPARESLNGWLVSQQIQSPNLRTG
jgi:hypothetical protein